MTYVLVSCRRCGDGGWRLYARDDAGSAPARKRVAARDAAEAERMAAEAVARLNGCETVGESLDEYVARAAERVTPYTLRDYGRLARGLSHLGDFPIDLLDASQAQAHFDGLLSDGLSRSMVAKGRNLASAAVRESIAAGRATKNPFSDVALPERPPSRCRSLDGDERERLEYLLSAANGKAAVAAGLALGCELSPGEVCALERDDVAFPHLVIARGRVTRSVGGASTLVAYDEPKRSEVPAWLHRPLASLVATREAFVVGHDGRPADIEVLTRSVNGLLASFGFSCRFSDLRRSAKASRRRA